MKIRPYWLFPPLRGFSRQLTKSWSMPWRPTTCSSRWCSARHGGLLDAEAGPVRHAAGTEPPEYDERSGRVLCERHGPATSTSGHRWRTKIRPAILKRDDYTCQLCGAPANAVDHIVPYLGGGTDDLSNLRALCTSCNSRGR